MRRKLAMAAAKWLGKRENRDMLMRSARKLKSRIEKEAGMGETRVDSSTHRNPSQPEHKGRRDN